MTNSRNISGFSVPLSSLWVPMTESKNLHVPWLQGPVHCWRQGGLTKSLFGALAMKLCPSNTLQRNMECGPEVLAPNLSESRSTWNHLYNNCYHKENMSKYWYILSIRVRMVHYFAIKYVSQYSGHDTARTVIQTYIEHQVCLRERGQSNDTADITSSNNI